MAKKILAGVFIWTTIVAYWAGPRERSAVAAQTVEPQVVAPARVPEPIVPRIAPESSVAQQMNALDRHARFNMILYPGRLGGGESAEANRQLRAIALSLRATGK